MTDYQLGNRLRVTLFGQSHAPGVGAVIEGLPAGMRPDWAEIAAFMQRRAPGKNALSSARREADAPEIVSGLNEEGCTCGAPLCALIRNGDARRRDYAALRDTPRPGHADYAAWLKYGEHWDASGGGQFSGRMTAPLCFAGALCLQILRKKGVEIAAHISRVGDIWDDAPDPVHPRLPLYAPGAFPTLNAEKGAAMQAAISAAARQGDSLGGAVRCVVTGVAGGLGGPLFGGLESRLAAALFAIPAVKGVEFGAGFSVAGMYGSENNDAFRLEAHQIRTVTNNAGGILGGVSTGMPLIFQCALKPTPSIGKEQQTVNLRTGEETTVRIQGRHDPCVVPRAVPVVEAMAALVLCDLILQEGK